MNVLHNFQLNTDKIEIIENPVQGVVLISFFCLLHEYSLHGCAVKRVDSLFKASCNLFEVGSPEDSSGFWQ